MSMKEQMEQHARGRFIKGVITDDELETEVHMVTNLEILGFAMQLLSNVAKDKAGEMVVMSAIQMFIEERIEERRDD